MILSWAGRKSALVAVLLIVPLDVLAEDEIRPRPLNFSSHGVEFFRGLLSGRTWLFEREGRIGAVHFGSDGSARGCWMRKTGRDYFVTGENWRWEFGIGIGGAKLNLVRPVKGRAIRSGMVLIYDGLTGRLHGERFDNTKKRWGVAVDGWLEDRWPGPLVRACRGLKLPSSVEMGDSNEGLSWGSARKRAKAVLRHPGWQSGFPGAVGLGNSTGKPTLTVEELREIVAKMNGTIVEDVNGEKRVVLVRKFDGELWKLDDNEHVTGVGTLELIRDGTVIVARWEPSGSVTSYYVGYPFPLRPTGRRYAAFRMMDDLVSQRRPVSVQLNAGGVAKVRLLGGGKLLGESVQGGWSLTEGAVVLAVLGREYRYPWRKFAEMTGWIDGQE